MERDATFRDTRTELDWLRHAAEALRRIAADATPGPWRWGDPGAAAGSRERHRTTLENLQTPSTFPTIRPPLADREAVLPGLTDPLELFEHAIDPIAPRLPANARWIAVMNPSIAEPLAGLLESLARNAEQAIEAGGQVDHEPYRYAVSLAQRIVDAVDDCSPAP